MIDANEAKIMTDKAKIIVDNEELKNNLALKNSKLDKIKLRFEEINSEYNSKASLVSNEINEAINCGLTTIDWQFAIYTDSDRAITIMILNHLKEKGYKVDIILSFFNSNTIEEPIDEPLLTATISW